jgi:WASH complex subunit strumpellin
MIELDEGFKETYIEIIERFYNMFESIYNYYSLVITYLNDIQEGKFIEFSLDVILGDQEGKVVLIEVIYHYGVMLLLLDKLIPSIARERMISCYVRYMSGSASPNVSYVVGLCKQTGYSYDKESKTEVVPDKYPCSYFARFKLDRDLVESLINTMKDDDIYDMISVYGNQPSHRSMALST